jgi:hypothetical protein
MSFARQRRLYYNLINSNLFCGINVDTEKLDINIKMLNNYLIYALINNSMKNRLISLVYSSTITRKAWFIALDLKCLKKVMLNCYCFFCISLFVEIKT